MSKIAVFFADGCEEIEGLTVVDMLRRANLDVVSVSITGSREVHGSHNITFFADTVYEEVSADTFDGIVLPGGAVGTEHLGAHEGVTAAVKTFAAQGKREPGRRHLRSAKRIGSLRRVAGKTCDLSPGMGSKAAGSDYM